MKWINLKNNKCPQCNKDFMKGMAFVNSTFYHPCGFRILETRYKEIVESIVVRGLRADQIINDEYDGEAL